MKTLCVLDTAASQSTIDEDFALSLGLALGERKERSLAYLDRQVSLSTAQCTVQLHSQDTMFTYLLKAEAVKGFSKNCRLWPWSNFLNNHPHLKGLRVPPSPLPPIGTILIGTDNPDLLQALEYRRSSRPNRPMAIRTRLGWGFFGPDPPGEDTDQSEALKVSIPNPTCKMTNADLAGILNRQFEIENLGALEEDPPPTEGMALGPKPSETWTPEERLADTLMTIRRVTKAPEPYFEGSIPWKRGHQAKLTGNFNAVQLRQERTHSEHALKRKGVTPQEIDEILRNYLKKQYIEPVPEPEEEQGWYLPFFEVVNREKSTPVRLVFDAKAKYKGTSLNQQILDTPNRLSDLTIILTRMRHYKYVLAGDISEMFLQIRLNPDDKPFHRFIHKGKHYQWTRTLFGNKASPNLSQKVLSTLCSSESGSAQAVETVTKSCYMDDCIDSRDTVTEIVELARELPGLLRKAGMSICKIHSNCPEALRVLEPSLIAKGINLEDRSPVFLEQRVLGLVYDPDKDELGYGVKYGTVPQWMEALGCKLWTKRSVLKVVASHYDPLGLSSPVTIRPRKLLQRIWTSNIGWDDPIGLEITPLWEEALGELLKMTLLRFPRWIGGKKNLNRQMHIYCDASSEVYACSLYLRTTRGAEACVSLLAAKARVTPIKTQSVSRSELDACVLGARMARHFNTVCAIDKENLFFYTDSRNVLFWLTTPPKKLKVFVQRRVAELQKSTCVDQWGHVATEENPADIATRDISVTDLSESGLWYRGPTYLRDPGYRFQKFERNAHEATQEGLGELKGEIFLTLGPESNCEVTRLVRRLSVGRIYNGLSKLMRIMGYILKLAGRSGIDERNLVYRAAQRAAFPLDIQSLELGQNPEGGSKILKLCPFLDSNGVLRAKSRLERSRLLGFDTKYPIILSGKEPIAQLVIADYHLRYQHPVGASLALAEIQKRFFVLGLTRQLKRLTSHCITCKKLRPLPGSQLMGPIPKDVIDARSRAFLVTGIDFAGPFDLKGAARGLRAPRRHVLVLTCLQTRAVHFEICSDQTTYAIVMALIRFACVRGDPEIIYSDNQTSFLGAKQEIARTYEDLRNCRPKWRTITPRAPHQGGKWERMVQSMKRALFSVGNSSHLKEEEFITFLARGADLLNSRPLTKARGEDLYQALTPNHFLLGRIDTGLDHPKIRNTSNLLGARYAYLERTIDKLWERFIHEVLLDSREREKWRTPTENLKEGTLVLVLDPNPLRKKWIMGIIEGVHKGADGYVRNATVRTNQGTFQRAVVHLVPLPDAESEPLDGRPPTPQPQ